MPKKKKKCRIPLPVWTVIVSYIFMPKLLFCYATLTVDIMVSSKAAAGLNHTLLSSHVRRNDRLQQLKWTVPILMWYAHVQGGSQCGSPK